MPNLTSDSDLRNGSGEQTTNKEQKVVNDTVACLQECFDKPGVSQKYQSERSLLVQKDHQHSWDAPAKARASSDELRAQETLFKIREHERVRLFGNLPGEAMPPASSRDMGGHFLDNLGRINQSKIFQIACQMPKGCHQHLHFNSEIPPEKLFPLARAAEMANTMCIRTTLPLTTSENCSKAEIVFDVKPKGEAVANVFSHDYNPDAKDPKNCPWMLWKTFRDSFPTKLKSGLKIDLEERPKDLDIAECWAREKMIITRQNAYSHHQTHNGAWACFNQGTRAFKGLLGYEGAYRWYIGHAIESMIADKVMYAELRPMLLDKTLPSNDGTRKLGHCEQMQIICEEVTKKQSELKVKDQLDKFPFGLKIIYCTPRSIPREKMKNELKDCIKLKVQFPDLICGFDLVGAEDRPNCINYYSDLLSEFSEACRKRNLSIPFMFHAGETLLDTGGSDDPDNSNLYDSLLLKAKRIGHGYALLKHPALLQKFKERKICLELCPISNELLHLCSNAREHPYPQLLAAGLHCTLNADNPSLFR